MKPKNQVNFYLILNVSPQADDLEIKKAYFDLARAYHPDKNRGNKLAEKRFQQINTAWQVLKDPRKRKLFDESLQQMKSSSHSAAAPLKNERAPPAQKQNKPIDLEVPLKISLEDLCQSRSKTVHYVKPVDGAKIQSSVAVQIPAGARAGASLRFKGQGGAVGKKNFGDLYVKIQIQPHKIFQLIPGSKDLAVERPISFIESVKGQKLEAPSPYGLLAVQLKPPVRPGQLLKIKGHGLPKNLNGEKGDLFVQIVIDYPLKNGAKIQRELEKMPFDKQKIYVEKFKNSSFVYPRILKFKKIMQELKEKSSQ